MAIIYVRSTTGSDANNGSTWALAKATITGAANIALAGDIIYVSQAHNETSTNVQIQPQFQGTTLSPNQVFCVDDSSQPPVNLATTGVVTVSGTAGSPIALNIGAVTYYGLSFNAGSGAGNSVINLGSGTNVREVFDTCVFTLGGTGSSARINLNQTTLLNCKFLFSATTQGITIAGTNNRIIGGGTNFGTASPASGIFKPSNSVSSSLIVEGFDMTPFSGSTSLVDLPTSSVNCQILFRDCKLPGSSWTGGLVFTTTGMHPQAVIEMVNCASGAQNFAYWRQMLSGSIRHETTVVRTGGATDGTTHLSWKAVTSGSIKYPNTALVTADIIAWNTTITGSLTATVEIITNNNITLNNDECWLEVLYLGTASFPLATAVNNSKANYLATAAAQPTSTATWTTTGLTTPIKQKLSVTITPRMVGFVIARVYLARSSVTTYIDPVITLS